jgi:hypothetical protein
MGRSAFDPYAVLGVARNATSDEVKAAYRELVAKYHPDHHQGNPLGELASEKLAEINRAYEILSDPERRAAYDDGQPSWPRPVSSPFDNMSFGDRRRTRRTWPYLIGIVLILPLLIRLTVFLVRVLVRLVRLVITEMGAARGTPLLLVVVVGIVAVAVFLIVRRRRR